MRVLAVTTWLPTKVAPTRGSFVVANLKAISRIAQLRLVHLVSPADDDGARHLTCAGIPVWRIPLRTNSPQSIYAASRHLEAALNSPSFRPQILHSMAFSSLEPLALLHPKLPWVHTEHWSALTAPETLPATARLALPLLQKGLVLPDLVTTDTAFLARAVQKVRANKRPTCVVPCIVEPYTPLPRRSRRDGQLRLVSVGGLIERKDPLLALEIVAQLRAQGIDAHLTWVGQGPLHDRVDARALKPDLSGHITLTGALDAAGVRAQLAASDLFLAPTKSDNFFIAVAEAIMAGRPVVAGAKGGHSEYLDPAFSRLVSAREPAAWAAAILELDALTRASAASTISASLGQRFSASSATRGYNAVYRHVLAPRWEQ